MLDWAVLAVSIFNTISFFWLGAMVLFTGDRRAAGAWLTGSGLLIHSAMLAAVGAHIEIRHQGSGGRRAVIHINTDQR